MGVRPSVPGDATRRRYDRIARIYDRMECLVEGLVFRRWRERLWSLVPSGAGLEVGVGTGKNMPYYPRHGTRVTAIDLSPNMLGEARRRAHRLGIETDLREMDAQAMEFPNASFDWAVSTFVFCSVPDPIPGLQELRRVTRSGGRVLLLEHVRIDLPIVGRIMDLLNPLVVRLTGANINRRTVENVRAAGLSIVEVKDLAPFGLVKLIVAQRF